MSYILEALKKSKEERLAESAPHLHVVHRAHSVSRQFVTPARVKIFVVLLVVLLSISGLAYLIYQNSKPVIPDVPVDNSSKITIGRLETRGNFADLGKERQETNSARSAKSGNKNKAIAKEEITKLGSTRVKRIVLGPSGTPKSKETAAHQEIAYRTDLPLEVQNTLPKLIFAGHTYADEPGSRMIIVNNTILREGASIDADTKLISIIWEGVVLEHKGIRYKERTH